MATIGQLAVSLGLNSSNFDKGMKNVSGGLDKAKSGFMTVGKVALGLTAGIAAAGGAMFAMGTKVGDLADEILDLNSITGMGTDSIQKWRKATEVAGVAQDAMTNASQKLTRNLDTMRLESNKGNKALEQLGFSLDEIRNMNADERMDALTNALSGVEDKTERARLGTDIFAGSWKEIAPVVDLGTEAMNKAKDSANIISEDDLKKANDFRITVANMKDQISFFVTEIAIKLLPILQGLMDWIQANMPQIQSVTEKTFDVIGQAVNIVVDVFNKYLMPAITVIYDWIKQYLPEIQGQWGDTFGEIGEIIKSFVELAQAVWDRYGDYIMKQTRVVFDTIKSVISGILDTIKGLLNFWIGLFTGDWERMGEGLKTIWNGLWEAIEAVVRGAWGLLSNAFSMLWDNVSDWFEGLKEDAKEWGANMIGGFVDGIKSMGREVARAAEDIVNQAGDFIKFWSPAKKGEGRFIVDWGENMIDGFLDGVRNAMPDVASTFNKVIPNMDMALTPSMAGMGDSVNNQSFTLNFTGPINVRNDNDINKIARELHFKTQTASRGRGI